MPENTDAIYFNTPEDLGDWLEDNHDSSDELIVGYYKKATGIPGITWPESVDEALCFGWIDGVRRRVDDKRYCIRFTPRRKHSHWSQVNIDRYRILSRQKRIRPAGQRAFRSRKESNTARASYEQGKIELDTAFIKRFKEDPEAWKDFNGRAPSYRRQCAWWIMSAKRESTRLRRLETLINCSAEGAVIPPLKWTRKK